MTNFKKQVEQTILLVMIASRQGFASQHNLLFDLHGKYLLPTIFPQNYHIIFASSLTPPKKIWPNHSISPTYRFPWYSLPTKATFWRVGFCRFVRSRPNLTRKMGPILVPESQPFLMDGRLGDFQPFFHGNDLGTIIQLKRCHKKTLVAFSSRIVLLTQFVRPFIRVRNQRFFWIGSQGTVWHTRCLSKMFLSFTSLHWTT